MRSLILLIVIVVLAGCGQENGRSDGYSEALQRLTRGTQISIIAEKYQATTGWEQDLVYTFQVQERLITGKPTLFTGVVDDVFLRNGKTFIRVFVNITFSELGGRFVLELECSRSIVDTIITRHLGDADAWYSRFSDEYVVVANIQEVSKPVIAFSASPFSEYDAEIVVETSDVFIAEGTCIDIEYIGTD